MDGQSVLLEGKCVAKYELLSTQHRGSCAIIGATVICVRQKSPANGIGPRDWALTQPMIPAHDCTGLHVFAGTWQSPANLYVVVGSG